MYAIIYCRLCPKKSKINKKFAGLHENGVKYVKMAIQNVNDACYYIFDEYYSQVSEYKKCEHLYPEHTTGVQIL